MLRRLVAFAAAALLPVAVLAAIEPYPASFQTKMVPTNGTSLYVRFGGKGPTVVLLHGFGDTGDMWAPLAAVLVHDHTVIVPTREWSLRTQDTGYERTSARYRLGDGRAQG